MTVARMALCAALLGSASAQGERLLYSHDLPPSRGTVAPEHAPLLTVAKLNAQVGGCDNTSVHVLAARTGAFVTPGQRDALYLYDSPCDDSVRFVLIRGTRALYSGPLAQPNSMASFVEAYVLRDINQDGREEFVTVFEIAASSAGLQWLTVWNPATLPHTGRVTRADTVLVSRTWCDLADSGPAGTLWHWNIYVTPSPTPKLSADAFRADSCRDGAPFRPTGRRGPAPRPDPGLLKDLYQ